MSDAHASPAPSDAIDVGSWTGFSSSLSVFLDDQVRLRHSPDEQKAGLTVLLTAPAPVVVVSDTPAPSGRLRSLRARRRTRRSASPDLPGVVLAGRTDGVSVDIPVLDSAGRLLLGDDARAQLTTLGWRPRKDLLTRLLPNGTAAAQAVTRLLIEVLHVAHPADLGLLVTDQH